MVAVRETFSLVKELLGGSLVEFSAHFVAERHPSYMEVSVLSLSNPVSPLGLLETVGRPVPSILRLDDVELSIKT